MVIGFISGYWAVPPLVLPYSSDKFLVEFILNPFEYLARTNALIIEKDVMEGLIRKGALVFLKQ